MSNKINQVPNIRRKREELSRGSFQDVQTSLVTGTSSEEHFQKHALKPNHFKLDPRRGTEQQTSLSHVQKELLETSRWFQLEQTNVSTGKVTSVCGEKCASTESLKSSSIRYRKQFSTNSRTGCRTDKQGRSLIFALQKRSVNEWTGPVVEKS